MDNETSSNINSSSKLPIKFVINIGKMSLIPLDESVKKRLEITEQSLFRQEITEDGILLRPIRNIDEYLKSNEREIE
jgi:hypothetical protein